jgi:prepilin-type N-terminal cleavage/methylation domain-containing protein
MKQIKSQQSGFTLIEIAIVLVIIGLLLGGVLKGQELIENSRIKSVVADMRGVSAAFTGYFDRYRALPGDELGATTLGRGWGAIPAGNNDGVLNQAFADTFTAGTAEHVGMWRVLRSSGFLGGNPAAVGLAALPVTGTGGRLGGASLITGAGPFNLQGPSVCANGLSHKQAGGVDAIIDGNAANAVGDARGVVGAIPAAGAPAVTAYNETLATTWVMCRRLQ